MRKVIYDIAKSTRSALIEKHPSLRAKGKIFSKEELIDRLTMSEQLKLIITTKIVNYFDDK